MATIYTKINDNEYQITETKDEVSTVKLDFIEQDIAHKEKLITELQTGITNLQQKKAELVALKKELLKL